MPFLDQKNSFFVKQEIKTEIAFMFLLGRHHQHQRTLPGQPAVQPEIPGTPEIRYPEDPCLSRQAMMRQLYRHVE